jgi:hypothetical protein
LVFSTKKKKSQKTISQHKKKKIREIQYLACSLIIPSSNFLLYPISIWHACLRVQFRGSKTHVSMHVLKQVADVLWISLAKIWLTHMLKVLYMLFFSSFFVFSFLYLVKACAEIMVYTSWKFFCIPIQHKIPRFTSIKTEVNFCFIVNVRTNLHVS